MAMEAAEFSFLWEPTLNSDVLRLILSRLALPLLAKAACVSRSWRAVATDPDLLMACFKAEWKLADVVGTPSGNNVLARGLHRVVISHHLQRWDTLESLAVKYDVQVAEIRKLNKMSSDYDVYCRTRLLIPVKKAQLLAGKTCYIEYDEPADCELAVVYLQGERIRSIEGQSCEQHGPVRNLALKNSRIVDISSSRAAGSSARTGADSTQDFLASISEVRVSREDMAENTDRFESERGEIMVGPSTSARAEGMYFENYETDILLSQSREASIPALTDDLWRTILELLPVPALGQAACVCRLWHSIAMDPAVLAAAFMAPWKLKEVVGTPVSRSFWRGQLGQFAISHALQRQDTIAGLAVKYGVQVPEIRRVNNMMSDHGIHSRDRLLIPVSKPELLARQTCFIETDIYAKREVGVLYLDGSKPNRREAARAAARAQRTLKRAVMESLKRSLRVDDSTAQYYFSLAEGDLRGALQEFSEDVRWERAAQ